jgi:short-subunit dehydrogenase
MRAMSELTRGQSERSWALITGASSGIGAQIAHSLARRRYDCVLTARREDRLEVLAKNLEAAHGVGVHVVASDLGRHGGAGDLIEKVSAIGVPVEVLVNNAGFGVYGPFVDQSAERLGQMIELNMVAVTSLTHHYVREMRRRGRGRVLQVASVGAYQPSPLYAVYSATKSYVLSFSEALNHELAGSGVTVSTMCPGLTETEFHDVAAHKKPGWMRIVTMSAGDVAEIGVRSMLRGRSVVTTGLSNKLMAIIVKLLPRSWATTMAGLSMRP